jgi:hypothetical protein
MWGESSGLLLLRKSKMSFTKAELFDGDHKTEKTLRELKKQAAKPLTKTGCFLIAALAY